MVPGILFSPLMNGGRAHHVGSSSLSILLRLMSHAHFVFAVAGGTRMGRIAVAWRMRELPSAGVRAVWNSLNAKRRPVEKTAAGMCRLELLVDPTAALNRGV